jgi:hypothetical protein
MPKFRKKPVVIEAVQVTATAEAKIFEFVGGSVEAFDTNSKGLASLSIKTLEGTMTAGLGDWIIKGVKGEFYPCKDDIFRMTYDEVEE